MKWSPFATLLLAAFAALAQSTGSAAEGQPPVARLLDSGLRAFNARDFAAAVQNLDALCRINPASTECARARLPLATAHFLSSRYQEAVRVLETLPESERSVSEVLHMMATSQIYLGRLDAAQRTFAALYGLPADSPEAQLLTARMMIRLERETEAEGILKNLLIRYPNLPTANYYLGVLFLGRSQFDEAIIAFQREVRWNPTYSDAYYKLGDSYGRKQEWRTAIPRLQMSIWLNPDQSGPYILLGKAYLNTGSLANAEAMLKRAIEIDPNNNSAAYTLAQILTKAGKHSEAKTLFDRVRSRQ